MKTRIIALVSGSLALLGGCTSELKTDGNRTKDNTHRVSVSIDTRVAASRVTTVPGSGVEGNFHTPVWETGDMLAVFTTGATANSNIGFDVANITDGVAGRFTGEIDVAAGGGAHTFHALYPWAGDGAVNNNINAYASEIPTVQTPKPEAIDSKAYLAVSAPLSAQIGASEQSVSLSGFVFKRLGALAVFNFTNETAIPASEKVRKVVVTAAPNRTLSGKASIDLEQVRIVEFTDPSNSVTAVFGDADGVTVDEFSAWFVLNPVVFSSGEKITIKVFTENHILTREITVGAEGLDFDTEKVTRIDVTLNEKFDIFSGTGITLPYVFSFLSAAPATEKPLDQPNAMEYNAMRMSDGSAWTNFFTAPPTPQTIEPKDGSGTAMTFYRYAASTTEGADSAIPNNGVLYLSYAGNMDNAIALQIWGAAGGANDPYSYILLKYPVGEPMSGTVYFSFCLAGTNYAPRNWTIQYSDDNATWMSAGDVELTNNKADIPYFFTVPVTLQTPLDKGSFLYVKILQRNRLRVGASDGTNCNERGVGRLLSALVLQQADGTPTQFPADAVYSEGFDGLFGGVDYLLGAPLCNMTVYSGDNFAAWNTAKSADFTAENVGVRPGYVQIGLANFQQVQPKDLVNNVGSLTTPALTSLTQATDVKLTFEAMAYKTGSTMSNAKDKDGDKTALRIEVLGGGTIGGETSVDVSGMSYTEFNTFELDVVGAISATQIKFTSTAAAGEFTRWFLDGICVTKQ